MKGLKRYYRGGGSSNTNGVVLDILSDNWIAQEDGTYTNTVSYEGFTSDTILVVDLYNDGNLTETQITEYDSYITKLSVYDGELIAKATKQPTETIPILCRGEFKVSAVRIDAGLDDKLEQINTQALSLLEEMNARLLHLEENFDILTTEEHTYTNTVSITCSYYGEYSVTATFDRVFVEPPAVSVVITDAVDGKFVGARVSNITTTSCVISASNTGTSVRTGKVQFTAIGMVRKV